MIHQKSRHRLNSRVLHIWVGLLLPILFASGAVGAPQETGAPNSAQLPGSTSESQKTPVLLLTGFEPFGPGRPPNSSWEGIKSLDGVRWNGFQLVCRRLPVVWGEPIKQIDAWIAELGPVAVFSFGQGGRGAFQLETQASNRRGGGADNKNETPQSELIVENGPPNYSATINAQSLADLLGAKGHSIRISTRAGAYLCEETLYSLEYLKSQRNLPGTVMFCHVPPLGGDITSETVKTFVLDLLSAWNALYSSNSQAQVTKSDDEQARKLSVRKFVDRYFSSWSNNQMDVYAAGFLNEATIQFIDDRGKVHTQNAKDFLADQRRYQATRPAREFPLSVDIRFEGPLARAIVYWKLEGGGSRTSFGYDHFTLVERDGNLRILNLVFYGTNEN